MSAPVIDAPKASGGEYWFIYILCIVAVAVFVMYLLNRYQEGRIHTIMDRMETLHSFNAKGAQWCDYPAEKYEGREKGDREPFVDGAAAPSPAPAPAPAPALAPGPAIEPTVPPTAPPQPSEPSPTPPSMGARMPMDMMDAAGPVQQARSQTQLIQEQQQKKLKELEVPELPHSGFFENENPADTVVYDRQITARLKVMSRNASDSIRGDLRIVPDPDRGMFNIPLSAMRDLNRGALSQIADVQCANQKGDILYSNDTPRDSISGDWAEFDYPPRHPYT